MRPWLLLTWSRSENLPNGITRSGAFCLLPTPNYCLTDPKEIALCPCRWLVPASRAFSNRHGGFSRGFQRNSASFPRTGINPVFGHETQRGWTMHVYNIGLRRRPLLLRLPSLHHEQALSLASSGVSIFASRPPSVRRDSVSPSIHAGNSRVKSNKKEKSHNLLKFARFRGCSSCFLLEEQSCFADTIEP